MRTGVQAAATSLIEADKAEEALAVVEKFHGALAQMKVLDPACGMGNFLYVALARMKELEGEVVSLLGPCLRGGTDGNQLYFAPSKASTTSRQLIYLKFCVWSPLSPS